MTTMIRLVSPNEHIFELNGASKKLLEKPRLSPARIGDDKKAAKRSRRHFVSRLIGAFSPIAFLKKLQLLPLKALVTANKEQWNIIDSTKITSKIANFTQTKQQILDSKDQITSSVICEKMWFDRWWAL